MLLATLVFATIALVTPSPSPSPSPSAAPKEIAHTIGRGTNLVGNAMAGSEGTIGAEQIETRPVLRPGEVLEAIPGLIISQHSGGGKANQYYLRGFQLDHGTDLEATIAGVPINLPTHAHGQGYSDINWLIPELVSSVEYKKGPYYADQGDFSTAGAYNLYYRDTAPSQAVIEQGGYGYERALLVRSTHRQYGSNMLYAFEAVHDDGSFDRPDDYRKLNGTVRYSFNSSSTNFNATAWAYSGIFNSSDQIPQRLIDEGMIDRFGLIDPSDGGRTSRFALSSEYTHNDSHGTTKFAAYGYEQYLDLFSNFTYFLDDATDYYNVHTNPLTCYTSLPTCTPAPNHLSTYTSYCPANQTVAAFSFSCGDQREQQDRRFVSGFSLSRTMEGPNTATTFGAGIENENISTVGLFLTHDRVRYPDGTLSDDKVLETDYDAYVQSVMRDRKLRVSPGIRTDIYAYDVHALQAANSGTAAAGIVNPKLDVAYEVSSNQELYADSGESFHSNDARGIFLTQDPQTHADIDPTGAAVTPVTPLVRAKGSEVGYRYSGSRLTTTISIWQLNLASELVFDGDHGVTTAGGPTYRYGVEFTSFYRPRPGLTIDTDIASSSARFTEDTLQNGTYVPESLNEVIAAGVTLDQPYYSASLRARYFGPRTLDTEGDAVSAPSLVFNGQFTAKLMPHYGVRLEALNIFNAQVEDVEYYYGSWVPQDVANYASNPAFNPLLGGSGVNDYHIHPSENRTFRLELEIR